MKNQPLAVLSDIHGNRWALEAVLSDIKYRGICDMVNLGDCLYSPLDPGGTAQILMELDIPTVRGNEDRIILDEPTRHADSPSLAFVQSSLKREHLQWLKTLPISTVAFTDFLMFHGTPEKDNEYFLQEVLTGGVRLRTEAQLVQMLKSHSQPLLLCGHDHIPAFVRLSDCRHIINPGSVGLPAYRDLTPFPHVMETGSPHARYSVVSRGNSGIIVQNIAVPYDWETAALTAEKNSRLDWARFLRSGRAKEISIWGENNHDSK